jgi:hypothetical protein
VVAALALLIAGAACGSEPAVVETEKQEIETIGETSGKTTVYYYKHLPLEGLQANIAAIKHMGYSAGSLERIPQRRLEGERSC